LNVDALQGPAQGALGVALVDVQGMGDDARRTAPVGLRIQLDVHHGDGRCPETQAQRSERFGHQNTCRASAVFSRFGVPGQTVIPGAFPLVEHKRKVDLRNVSSDSHNAKSRI